MQTWSFELNDGNTFFFSLNAANSEEAIAKVEGYAPFSADQVKVARPFTEEEEQKFKKGFGVFIEEYIYNDGSVSDKSLDLFLESLEGLEELEANEAA